MDCEKKYKEALEKAKIWQEHLYEVGDKDYADELNYIFPELAESEDEKIRKALIEYFNEQCDMSDWNGVYGYQVVAWLEKQGTSYTKRDIDDAYIKGMSDAKRELEKQGEKKCIDDLTQQEAMDIAVAKCFEQGGQKPTWSEEDDSMFQSCIGAVATNDYYKGEEKE